jgi:hypothetical protein
LASYIFFTTVGRWAYARAYRANRFAAAINEGATDRLDEPYVPALVRVNPLIRLVEVVIMTYHLPILATAVSVRKRRSIPGWIVFGVTPIVYTPIIWLISAVRS